MGWVEKMLRGEDILIPVIIEQHGKVQQVKESKAVIPANVMQNYAVIFSCNSYKAPKSPLSSVPQRLSMPICAAVMLPLKYYM